MEKSNIENKNLNSLEPIAPAKLAYNAREVCVILGISRVSLWRIESRSLLRSVGCIRSKCYPHSEIVRFLAEQVSEKWTNYHGKNLGKKSQGVRR